MHWCRKDPIFIITKFTEIVIIININIFLYYIYIYFNIIYAFLATRMLDLATRTLGPF